MTVPVTKVGLDTSFWVRLFVLRLLVMADAEQSSISAFLEMAAAPRHDMRTTPTIEMTRSFAKRVR
jgi:hypothetical protein